MADQTNVEDEKLQAFIKRAASMDEAERKQAVHDYAVQDLGKYGKNPEMVAIAEADLLQEVDAYNKVSAFDRVSGVFTDNSIVTTSGFDKNGYTGQSTKAQHQIPFFDDLGAAWANATLNQDAQGNVTGGSLGVNYVGIPERVGDYDFVPVGNATYNMPVDKDWGAENLSLLGGFIVKPHGPDTPNLTLAGITNGKLSEFTGYGRISGTAYRNDNTTVTPFLEASYGVNSQQLSAGAGVRVDRSLGDGHGVYVQLSGGLNNVSGHADPNAQVAVGYTIGAAEEKPSEVEQNFSKLAPKTPMPNVGSDTMLASNQLSVPNPAPEQVANNQKSSATNTTAMGATNPHPDEEAKKANKEKANGVTDVKQHYDSLKADPAAQSRYLNDVAAGLAKSSNIPLPLAKAITQEFIADKPVIQQDQAPTM